jgi:hypothetical protein
MPPSEVAPRAAIGTVAPRHVGLSRKAEGRPVARATPLALQQFHIKGAICKPLRRGPISRPYSHREPVLIGVPLELLAEPDLMDKPSLQDTPSRRLAREALQRLRPSYTRCSSFPQG